MKSLTVTFTGTKPLLTHNGQMADPANEHALRYAAHMARKPNSRAKATKENPELLAEWYAEERRILFAGSVYYDAALGFHLPADNALKIVMEAYFGYSATQMGTARLSSMLEIDRDAVPYEYEGPRTPDERFEAGLYRVGTVSNKAMGGARTRVLQPVFHGWSMTVTYRWPELLEREGALGRGRDFSASAMLDRLVDQGIGFGVGAFRKSPNYGKYTVQAVE